MDMEKVSYHLGDAFIL